MENSQFHILDIFTERGCQYPTDRKLGNPSVCLNVWGTEKCVSLMGNKPWVYIL